MTTSDAAPTPILDLTQPEPPFPVADLLKQVAAETGKPLQRLVQEMAKLGFGPGKLDPEEYFALRVYDDALSDDDRRAFAGLRVRREIARVVNACDHWNAVYWDKMVFNTLLGGMGLPVIATKSYYHATRHLPLGTMLRSHDEIVGFLRGIGQTPVFGKPTLSSLSLGIVSIDRYEASEDMLVLASGRRVAPEALAGEVIANYASGFVFQERARPAAEIEAVVGPSIPTVRVYTTVTEKGPEIFGCCWKVPTGVNMADNFWRKGNILAALDTETGTVKRAVSGTGINQIQVQKHPDTQADLVGFTLPDWSRLKETALLGAEVLRATPLVGWDIAPTSSGPVLVEANNAPDFSLIQIAEHKGVLDGRLEALVKQAEARNSEDQSRRDANAKTYKSGKLKRIFGAITLRAS